MQRGSTILQNFIFRPNVSISDPTTSDGRLWNSALKSITRSQGWSQLHWGTQLASEEVVDLLISKSGSKFLKGTFDLINIITSLE